MRVLVAEDERKVADAIREGLEAERYSVVVERTGEEAFFRINTDVFDLILLDLMLPGRDGLQILVAIRNHGCKTPVLVLTARDTLEDRIAGLDAGADDYLVKPFDFSELLARMRALLRRPHAQAVTQLRVGPLALDVKTRSVTRDGLAITLTPKEFELLECLMRSEGRVVSRGALGREVWKELSRSSTLDNVIDVHIARLRRKLDGEQPVALLHTVRGVGFILRVGE
jgi:two-component system copper resistance phosphate regulon response regulator CusR